MHQLFDSLLLIKVVVNRVWPDLLLTITDYFGSTTGRIYCSWQKRKILRDIISEGNMSMVSVNLPLHAIIFWLLKLVSDWNPLKKNRVVILRALSKNSKNKIDKKSGRKQPRANDYEIEFEPAPDSAFSLNTPLKQTLEKTPSTVGSIEINKTPKNNVDISTQNQRERLTSV